MKLVFIGPTLQTQRGIEALAQDHNILAVFTLPPEDTTHKVRSVDFTPLAARHHFAVHTTALTDPSITSLIRSYNPDLMIELGDSRIVPPDILSIPKYGTIGSHGGPLPYIQGAASLSWALIFGENRWGVSLYRLAPKVDQGDIIDTAYFPIILTDDFFTIHEKSDAAIVALLQKNLSCIETGTLHPTPNLRARKLGPKRLPNETLEHTIARNNAVITAYHARASPDEPVYLPRRTPEDGIIDWRRTSMDIYNWIRAQTHPLSGAWTLLEETRLTLWSSAILYSSSSAAPGTILSVHSPTTFTVETGLGQFLITNSSSPTPLNSSSVGKQLYVPPQKTLKE